MHAGRSKVSLRGRGHSAENRRIWWRKKKRPEWMTQEQYDLLPEWLRLRALRVDVHQRGFRSKRLVLVTTLTDAQVQTFNAFLPYCSRRPPRQRRHCHLRP